MNNGTRDINIPEVRNFSKKDFEKYKSWLDFYSRGSNVQVNVDYNFTGLAAIDTSNLKKPIVTINPVRISEKYECGPEDVIYYLFHEIEHLEEDAAMRSTRSGETTYNERLERLKAKGVFAKAFHSLENALRDAFVDNEIMSTKKAPVLKNTIKSNYKNICFKETNYEKLPLHVQFNHALLRETMVPEERCSVDPRVRREIETLKRSGILNKSISGGLESRLKTIWSYIEPTYEMFLKKDLEEGKKGEGSSDNKNGGNEGGEGQPSDQNPNPGKNPAGGDKKPENGGAPKPSDDKSNPKPGEGGEPQNSGDNPKNEGLLSKAKRKLGKKIRSILGDKDDDKDKKPGSDNEPPIDNPPSQNDDIGKNPFDSLYDKDIPHILDDNLSDEDKDKLKDKLKELAVKGKVVKSDSDIMNETRVRNLGVNPESTQGEDLLRKIREYDNFLRNLENVKDSETGNSIIEEITNLFSKIVSRRRKPRYQSSGPVDMEIGDQLFGSALAEGIGSIKAGNRNPEMFEYYKPHHKEKMHIGNFELDVVFDGTGSMSGKKNTQQKIAGLLIFEALRSLHDKINEVESQLEESLEFTTCSYIFGKNSRKIKKKSSEFNDKDRLDMYKALDECDGPDNNEGLLLEKMYEDFEKNYSTETKEKIKIGKIKKIIFVLTDGDQDNDDYKRRLLESIQKFREAGVLVYGIGITTAASAVPAIYGGTDRKFGYGEICENPENLAKKLKDMLFEHLASI